MKKVLLAGTAIVGLALAATPAQADLNLDLGGLFRGYIVNVDDDVAGARELDFRRDAEIHFTGESTLDNGLTVGIHYENKLGDNAGLNSSDEVYAYFSGGWGRVNFGSEDGAAYLLQVAAPSADSNIDGLRTYIQGFGEGAADMDTYVTAINGGNFTTGTDAFGSGVASPLGGAVDYDHADFSNTDRFTYLTPKFSGFQAGISYAPESGQNDVANNIAAMTLDSDLNQFEDLWEASVRWDGEFEGFGLSLGGAYSQADVENDTLIFGTTLRPDGTTVAVGDYVLSDFDKWNVGANVTFAGFSLGASYSEGTQDYNAIVDDASIAEVTVGGDIEAQTYVIGAGWDNGPYHLGASYLNTEFDNSGAAPAVAAAAGDITIASRKTEVDKITIGGGYTFGPGMTFRGAVAWGEYESFQPTGGVPAATLESTSNDFTQITLGTDIQF